MNARSRVAEIPKALRQEVLERDNQCCRICGRWVDSPALHHIEYKSEGGLTVASNLVTIGWLPGHECHLSVAHSNKRLWQPILMAVVELPGVTAYQWRRWHGGLSERPR